MEIIKKYGKIIGLGAMVLAIIGLFFSFATVSSQYTTVKQSVTFINGDGKIVLIAMIVAVVLLFINKTIPALILSAASLGITIYDGINVSKLFNSFGTLVDIKFGIGFYIVLIALIIATLMTGYALINQRKNK